ncbi:Alpha/Beta hydrolase protein [Roridomyces roridus]|uniref:Alpha/Beta hydrolase protein n=1 Tax=Roridomyces roridus TaxID=1738132 RepID=A0AAD7FF06_9AGAR|nr:Alpha/Beta hydrolase protein [Roridomyces roridus]
MALPSKPKYGELSWTSFSGLVAALLPLPIVLLWKALTHLFSRTPKSLRRRLGDHALLYIASNSNLQQMKYLLGTTSGTYERWSKAARASMEVDELGGDAKLLWIGPKSLDRVILVLHGGGYLLPAPDYIFAFYRYIQVELEKRDMPVGIALLQYSLAPFATFPTPLNQLRLATEFLLASGVSCDRLQLSGDSAGGNLAFQFVSHILHPSSTLPEIKIPAPIRGICAISPWVSMSADSPSWMENDGKDTLLRKSSAEWGRIVRNGFPEEHDSFAEPGKAPSFWFQGIGEVVGNILITAGEDEGLRDDIVGFAEELKRHAHSGAVELVVQEGGLHEDPFLDFFAGEKRVGSLTTRIVDWFAVGFT